MDKSVTITDVARLAGVSIQTVSNVLNRPHRVAPATRRRVEQAIAQTGYRTTAAARKLRTRRSDTIGFRLSPVVDGISGTLLDTFLHALTAQASERGLRVMLYTAKNDTDELFQINRLITACDIDGVILTDTHHADPRAAWMRERNIPFVALGRPWGAPDVNQPPHPWVDVDGAAGTRIATEHLRAGGGKKIGFLGWPSDGGTGADRVAGWRETMAATGEFSRAELAALEVCAADCIADAAAATRRLLATIGNIDGLVCASDSLALGAHMVLPPAVPVLGFDNTGAARALGISSVDQCVDTLAQQALALLLDADGVIKAPVPIGRLVRPRLVLREALQP